MQIYHITIVSRGRRTLARGEDEMRALVRALPRPTRGGLLLFSSVDEHAHINTWAARPRLMARDLVRSIRRALPHVEIEPPHVRPVEHALPVHPALWSGSCFLDLVRARMLPGFSPRPLSLELPRLRRQSLFEIVGLPATSLVPADDAALAREGVAGIIELAASVFALPSGLPGRTPAVVEARSLAVKAALRAGFPASEIARFLAVKPRAVRRLAEHRLPPKAEPALRTRLALEERVRATRRSWPATG